MNSKNFSFSSQYNQFYIEDGQNENKGSTDSLDFWDEDSFNSRMALIDGIIGISTQSYGRIKGEIAVLDEPRTKIDYSKYDHIVEGGIYIRSGEIQILNCPDSDLEVSLKTDPGKYRVRIYSSNLESVKEPDLVNDTDDDYYRIELWKSDDMERKVLKQYVYKE